MLETIFLLAVGCVVFGPGYVEERARKERRREQEREAIARLRAQGWTSEVGVPPTEDEVKS